MTLSERINNDLKEAMKSGEKDRLLTLRDIKSKLLLEMTREGGDGAVDDNRGIAILNKLYKQRMESIAIFETQNRQDLVDKERLEADVIKTYLPAMMEGDELAAAVKKIVAEVRATSQADIGKVMGVASKALAGKADGKAISEVVKKLLAGG
ncbi:MAG: GatB/YqeY domain-containing protein [Flavobacteriales bacterium]|nr:GatB/YqeY domain-containing protein [Flavobacteriales bacterium]